MSSQLDDDPKPTALGKDDLQAVSFDRFDKLIIVCLISVFVVLFIWLLAFNNQPFYSYLTFLGLLTLVLVGILRAVGLFRTSMIALGGAAGVFVGLFLLTEKYYDQSEQIRVQNEQIKVLKCLDPACNTLRRYFAFIQARDFKNAISLLSDTWKQQQQVRFGQDYYDKFPAMFDTTNSYSNVVILLRDDHDQMKDYAVAYDVTDDIQKNTLYEKRKQILSSLTGSFDSSDLEKSIIDDLNAYYVVPADKSSEISQYVHNNVTIDEAIDPFFITELVIELRRNEIADLKRNSIIHPNNQIERHFVHRVTMFKEHDDWKILNFERSFIANYPK
jgi:hypothetical protein